MNEHTVFLVLICSSFLGFGYGLGYIAGKLQQAKVWKGTMKAAVAQERYKRDTLIQSAVMHGRMPDWDGTPVGDNRVGDNRYTPESPYPGQIHDK